MKLVDSSHYLAVIEAALVTAQATDDAQRRASALAVALTGVRELQARTTVLPPILKQTLDEGRALARELAALINGNHEADDRGRELASLLDKTATMGRDAEHFEALLLQHNALVDALSQACQWLESRYTQFADEAFSTALASQLRRAAEWEQGFRGRRMAAMGQAASAPAPTSAHRGPALDNATLAQAIRAAGVDSSPRVENLRSISGGMSKETWFFDLVGSDASLRPMVVRKQVPEQLVEGRNALVEAEFALLKALKGTGLPVPDPLLLCTDPALTDTPYMVMPRMPGIVPATYFGPTIEITDAMVADLAGCLARLHAIPVEHFRDYLRRQDGLGVLSDSTTDCYRRALGEWREHARRLGLQSSLTLAHLFNWLEAHLPDDPRPPVLTHGDGNFHNVLVDGDQLSALLDWEFADFGAPEQDLGYLQRQLGSRIDWDGFLGHYARAGGRELRHHDLPFYVAYQYLRLCISACNGVARLEQGQHGEPRLLEIDLLFLPHTLASALESTRSA